MATRLRRLRALHSHLYVGALLHEQAPRSSAPRPGEPIVVEFADLSVAQGEVADVNGGQWVLSLQPYRTARGTSIAAWHWRLRRVEQGENAGAFKVVAKQAGA